jgi:four helix bundle protein
MVNCSGTKIRSFTDLVAWKEAHKLVLMIYKATNGFPKSEIYGLTDQIRRASVSISFNIAEGFSRRTNLDKKHFYYQALGSLTEVQNQLLIAKDIGYLKGAEFKDSAEQTVVVSKLINSLLKYLSSGDRIPNS